MVYSGTDDPSERRSSSPATAPTAVRKLIAGGFGVGKTAMVGAVSEVAPLSTEEHLTVASVGVDDIVGVDQRTTTTVALDFVRITVSTALVVYPFVTPGQERFWFVWNDLVHGALGAVVQFHPDQTEPLHPRPVTHGPGFLEGREPTTGGDRPSANMRSPTICAAPVTSFALRSSTSSPRLRGHPRPPRSTLRIPKN